MKGGHRGSGRLPDPTALRRDRNPIDWVVLPVEGRSGPPPSWPLVNPSPRELDLWSEEWRRPQAVIWESHHMELPVALYTRVLAEVEQGGRPVALAVHLRQLMDDLGLTLSGLQRNRWRFGTTEPAEVLPIRTGPSTRDRFGPRGRGEPGDPAS